MLIYKGTHKLLYDNGYKLLFKNKTHIKFYYKLLHTNGSYVIEYNRKTKELIEFTELDFLYVLCDRQIIRRIK